MKQNKIRINVQLWEKDANGTDHGGNSVTVEQELELPVAAPGDDGRGQIDIALRGYQRHFLKQLEKLGVLEPQSYESVVQKHIEEVAPHLPVPAHMLFGRQRPVEGYQPIAAAGIVSDAQSTAVCPACGGNGTKVVRELAATLDYPDGIPFDRTVTCSGCNGFGFVGV